MNRQLDYYSYKENKRMEYIMTIINGGRKMIKVRLEKKAHMPFKKHKYDAGWDLHTPIDVCVAAHSRVAIGTGVHIAIPRGYYGAVKSRSSMMMQGIITDGTIDYGYTGEVKVVLFNLTDEPFIAFAGERIAQLVIQPVNTTKMQVVEELDETDRGDGGFGSTGK